MNLKVLSIVMGLLLSLCGYRATAKSSEQNVEWKAKWISSGTTREQPNTWLNFRKEVNLPNVPTSVIARIGADSKYLAMDQREAGGLRRRTETGPQSARYLLR